MLRAASRVRRGAALVAYCPWFFSAWLQAADNCGRFCCRQARITKSPWSITLRQWRWTSRLQAACSSGVPLRCCCWATAPVETVRDNKVSARRDLRTVILLFRRQKILESRARFGTTGTDFFELQTPRNAATSGGQALPNAAKLTAALITS